MKRLILALGAVIVAAALLCSCSKTVTVTEKYQGIFGWYFVCTGPTWAPCIKGDIWRVSKAQYDQAVVGQPYTISLP